MSTTEGGNGQLWLKIGQKFMLLKLLCFMP